MSLLADLRAVAEKIDPQFQVVANDVQKVLAALVHYTEHGDELLKAAEAGVEEVTKLLAPPPPDVPAEAPSSPEEPSAAPTSDSDLEKQISDLQAQLDARRATEQATTVTHEPGAPTEGPVEPSA